MKAAKMQKVIDQAREKLESYGLHNLGASKAKDVLAALAHAKEILQQTEQVKLLTPHDVWEAVKDIRDHRKEHFVVFFLDTRSQEIKREVVSIGTLNASLVHPREVFLPAITNSAAQIIVAHNHPSGNSEPSEEDIELTRRLSDAGRLLGIELLDHVVVTKSGYMSLREQKFM